MHLMGNKKVAAGGKIDKINQKDVEEGVARGG